MSRNNTDSFQASSKGRTKSQVRFAVEEEVERHGSNLDKLTLSNTLPDSRGSSGHGSNGSNGNSPSNSMNIGHSNNNASNPQAKIARTRSVSRSFSSLELQFAAQQADKYDTLMFKLGKSFYAILVLLITTVAMVLSKTSMIYITESVDTTKASSFNTYVMEILFIVIAPLVCTAVSDLMYFWVRETKEKKRDPKAKRVRPHAIFFFAFIEGTFEAVGTAIFIMMVLPSSKIESYEKIFLLNGLCVVPVVCALIMKWKKWLRPSEKNDAPHGSNGTDMELHEMENGQLRGEKKKKKDGSDMCSRFVVTAVQLLFLIMQLAGMALLMIKSTLWWQIPVSLILCSISWWKNFVFIDRLDTHWADGFKRNRYASSFVKTFAKIAFILIFVTIIAKYYYHMDTAAMLAPSLLSKTFVNSHGLWYSLIGSWVAFYICWLSCLACMQIFCVALPVLLTTPLAIFYQTWNCKYYIYGAAWSSCKTFTTGDLSDGYIIAGGVLLWLSFIIVSGHLWAGIDKRDANQLEEDMWTQPEAFSCVFIEQSIALNRNRNPKVVKSLDGEVEYGFHAHRTFITTTMYHESKQEMQKLVMSLLQIDAEIPTEDKVADYYEAHIIFDDAFLKQPNAKPDHFEYSPFYNQWVLFLMDIFSELKLKRLGDAVVVWYGEVLTFKFALGMKLVVHLKDVTKIKQKKRWSQILYMHVILEDVLDNENKLGMLDANTFILMIDGDTQFSRKSVNLMRHMIELDRERSGAICGRIFPEGSSNPVVWYQKFEYAVGHWMQKTAEHVFGSVLCSPGCFSLVRIAALYRKSGEQMDGQSAAIEVYSKEVESAMDVLKFDQGEDRMLSTLIIKSGWRLQYCAGAEAGTFCPEAFGDFFKQRRRWISSTLANLYFLIASGTDIVKTNASVSPPFMLYTAGVFASSIFGPATIILVTIGGMAYAFNWYGATAYGWGLGMPLFYCAVCIVFNLNMETDTARKKSKKIDMQVGAAFLLCALYALLMGAVMIGVIASSISDPEGPDAIFLIVLAGTFIIAATLHGEFWLLLYGIVYLFLLPTMYLILILFAVANIHDQSWGTRDGSGGSKETDADKFFSIAKLGFYFRDMKASFKEAFYDELPPKKKEEPEDPWKRADYWKVSDDGKEEIVMLEEERRKLEEEKKKQEEEKKKQEEERQLREIERQKEEAKKKKQESEERERLQERLKQERRRGIHHKYKDHLSSLSRRLKNKVQTEDKPNEKDVAAEKLQRIRELAALQQMSCFMLFLVTCIWLILVVTFGIHPELNVIKTNAAGLMFLISFGIIQAFQFTASIFHRLETMLNALANIPMTVECNFVEEGKKYDRMVTLKQQEQELNAGREKIASKVARKLLMVDKRTSTKANLLS